MRYYKIKTCPPIVGADAIYVIKIDVNDKEEAEKYVHEIAHEQTVNDYESYGIEEDEDFETEYIYICTEITEEEYKEELEDGTEEINI